MVVAVRTVVVSLLLGTGVTLLASVVPARRATRVPPIAAVREGAAPAGRASARGSARGSSRRSSARRLAGAAPRRRRR